MSLKISPEDVKNKKVILRVDYNCPMSESGQVLDDYRICGSLETVDFLLKAGASRIVFLSHLGRPDGKFGSDFSLAPIVERFNLLTHGKPGFSPAVLLGYEKKITDCVNKALNVSDQLIFLENVRFWKEEEAGEKAFAAVLAELGDVFVNDAFGACHRAHASISGIAEFLPSFAGKLLEKELSFLGRAFENPTRPAIAVIGGAKLETKIPVIKKLKEKYDQILLGGLIAIEMENILKKGESEFDSDVASGRIKLPLGYVGPNKEDIDQETALDFSKIIVQAKTIFWNGPMGKFEEPPYDKGSRVVASAIASSSAYSVAGGGETNEMLSLFKINSGLDFVSTGGGVMLEMASGAVLPGVEALKKRE
jgi:phosphoglycerate kinase